MFLSTKLKSVDSSTVLAATPAYVTLSFIGNGLIVLPMKTGRACEI